MSLLYGLFVWLLVVLILGVMDGIFPFLNDITILSIATLLAIAATGISFILETK